MENNNNQKSNRKSGKIAWQNVILAAGLVLVMAGVFLLAAQYSQTSKAFVFRPVVCGVLSLVLLFVSFGFTKSASGIACGIFFFLCAIIFLLIDTKIVPVGLKELWPLFVIAAGLSIMPASIFKFKKVRSVHLFPSIVLVLLGGAFLPFSFHMFNFSFAKFISDWWPAILIICGVALLVLYFVQQSNRKKFPYMQDDSLVQSDSEE